MANNFNINIDSVVEQARELYESMKDSKYVFSKMIIDGQETRGQIKDKERITNLKEENTKNATCLLDCKVKRGSVVDIYPTEEDGEILHGIVMTIPNRTPVDYYFSILIFNTTVDRVRIRHVYNDDGDIVDTEESVIADIPVFVQRVGMRERTIDAGIDRNSVNRMYSAYTWDIKKDDLLRIGEDTYIITDIEELDKEVLNCYMTYYRE